MIIHTDIREYEYKYEYSSHTVPFPTALPIWQQPLPALLSSAAAPSPDYPALKNLGLNPPIEGTTASSFLAAQSRTFNRPRIIRAVLQKALSLIHLLSYSVTDPL